MSTITPAAATEQTPVWGLAMTSFLPQPQRERANGFIKHVPLALLVLVQLAVSLRLSNSAFEDEALYIGAGHDYLAYLTSGDPVFVPYGDFFSGLPMAYPVLAALLDSVGGLWLVRAFSALCMVAAMLCVRSTASYLWGNRPGNLAALAFVLSGPVMFVGFFATFDAICLALVATGVWIGVTRRSNGSAIWLGAVLAAAATVKYTGFVFIPVVLAITLIAARRKRGRAFIAGGVTVALLAAVWFAVGERMQQGIAFTTSAREALSPTGPTLLAEYVLLDVGLLLALALAGAVSLSRTAFSARSARSTLLALALLGGAALLPAAQFRLGEAVSFEKHLAYSALFLAPLAGVALAALTRRRLGFLLVIGLLWVLGVTGLARSFAIYQWPDVRPIAQIVQETGEPGEYLSTSARTLNYYTTDDPSIVWTEHYGLFDSGRESMQQAVDEGRFEMIILRSGSSGNLSEDERTEFFRGVVASSDEYQLAMEPFPVRRYSDEEWLIYERS